MAEQAYAYVTLIPVAKGFERELAKHLAQADKPSKSAGDTAGEKFVDGFKGGFRAVMGTVAAAGAVAIGAAATGLGVALNKGFDRLQNIERARNLLQGIGLDSVTVENVMDNALASVRGTAFGLDEAAQVAASAVAAGIEPGQELERVLGVVADTATVTGTSMDDVGAILNKVFTQNKAGNRELQQLAERGIPIYQMLADQFGVTADEIFNMASNGEIGADMLVTALEDNLAGAALNAGQTVEGSMANLGASISRVGANILSGVFAELPGFFQGITEALGPLEDAAVELGVELAQALAPAMDSIIQLLPDLIGALLPAIPAFADLLALALEIAVAVLPVLVSAFSSVVSAIASVITWIKENQTVATGLAIVFGTFTGVLTAFAVVAKIKAAGGLLALLKGIVVATKAQMGFNLALLANPIGLVVAAIAALVAGLIYFFTQTETGKQVLQNIFDWFKGIPDALRGAWESVTGFFSDLWNGIIAAGDSLKGHFTDLLDTIMGALSNFGEWISGIAAAIMQGLWDGIQAGWKATADFFKNMFKTISGWLSGAARWLINTGRNIISGLWNGIQFIWRTVSSFYLNMARTILGWLSNAISWLVGIGRDIIQGLRNGIDFIWNALRTWFGGIRDRFVGFFRGAIGWLLSLGRDILQGLRNGVDNAWNGISSWFGGIKNRFLGFFSGAGSWLRDIGSSIISGLLNGLTGAWKSVTDWISGAAKGIAGPFKKILGIESPSKVFAEFGRNIGEGLVLGMSSMEGQIESRVGMLVQVPDVDRSVGRQQPNRTVVYNAAPNQSLNAEQELMKAMRRARLVAQW